MRWAMTNTVRRRARVSRSSASRMAASVSVSTAEVLSSRINRHGSTSRARAIASRWRWPPDRPMPRSPTSVAYPWGSSAMNACAWAARVARRVEHIEDPRGRSAGARDRGGQEADRQDGLQQESEVGVERDQFPDRQRVAHHQRPAEADDHERAQVGEEEDEREVVGQRAHRHHIALQELGVGPAVALELVALATEGTDHSERGKVLLHEGEQPAYEGENDQADNGLRQY